MTERKNLSMISLVVAVGLILCNLILRGGPCHAAEAKKYIMPSFIDGSGVYAQLYTTTVVPAAQAAYDGWNAEIGAKIGVQVVNKLYDTRYDFSEAANLYDRCVISDNPVAINSLVSPSTLANLKKFARNQTPAVQWFGYGAMHSPGAWAFLPGRAYVIQYASAIDWLATKDWKQSRKPRVAFAIFSGVYGKDVMSIMEPWLKTYNKVDYAGVFWHDAKPVDLSGYVRDLMKAEPDYVMLSTTSISLPAYYNALKELGYLGKVVNVHPVYQGLDVVGRVLGFDKIEGDYSVAPANAATDTKAHEYFAKYANKYYSGAFWGATTVSYSAGTFLLLAAIEKAARKVGSDKVTGKAVYEQINGQKFTSRELAGIAEGAQLIPEDRLSGVTDLYVYKIVNGKEVPVGQTKTIEDQILKPWVK